MLPSLSKLALSVSTRNVQPRTAYFMSDSSDDETSPPLLALPPELLLEISKRLVDPDDPVESACEAVSAYCQTHSLLCSDDQVYRLAIWAFGLHLDVNAPRPVRVYKDDTQKAEKAEKETWRAVFADLCRCFTDLRLTPLNALWENVAKKFDKNMMLLYIQNTALRHDFRHELRNPDVPMADLHQVREVAEAVEWWNVNRPDQLEDALRLKTTLEWYLEARCGVFLDKIEEEVVDEEEGPIVYNRFELFQERCRTKGWFPYKPQGLFHDTLEYHHDETLLLVVSYLYRQNFSGWIQYKKYVEDLFSYGASPFCTGNLFGSGDDMEHDDDEINVTVQETYGPWHVMYDGRNDAKILYELIGPQRILDVVVSETSKPADVFPFLYSGPNTLCKSVFHLALLANHGPLITLIKKYEACSLRSTNKFTRIIPVPHEWDMELRYDYVEQRLSDWAAIQYCVQNHVGVERGTEETEETVDIYDFFEYVVCKICITYLVVLGAMSVDSPSLPDEARLIPKKKQELAKAWIDQLISLLSVLNVTFDGKGWGRKDRFFGEIVGPLKRDSLTVTVRPLEPQFSDNLEVRFAGIDIPESGEDAWKARNVANAVIKKWADKTVTIVPTRAWNPLGTKAYITNTTHAACLNEEILQNIGDRYRRESKWITEADNIWRERYERLKLLIRELDYYANHAYDDATLSESEDVRTKVPSRRMQTPMRYSVGMGGWHLAQYDLNDVKELAENFRRHVNLTSEWWRWKERISNSSSRR